VSETLINENIWHLVKVRATQRQSRCAVLEEAKVVFRNNGQMNAAHDDSLLCPADGLLRQSMTNATAAYIMSTYLVGNMSSKISFGTANAMIVQLVLWTVLTAGTLIAGRLIDRLGRKQVAITSSVGIALVAVPAIAFLQDSSLVQSVLIVIVVAVFYAGFTASTALAMVELLPPAVRASGAAISYQVAYAVFGGSAPILATWWVSMGFTLAPGIYLASLSAVSTVVAAIWIGNQVRSNAADSGPVQSPSEASQSNRAMN
jgi:MFS family permease